MTKSNTTEERRARFLRLAPRRTQRVLRAMDILANCSNNSNYVYTPDQARKILDAIEGKLEELRIRFTSKKGTDFEL